MPVHNADIARVFDEIADLLELRDENPFRIRAYRNAAQVVGMHAADLKARLAAGGELPKLPGIGEDLAGKIREVAATGTCALLEKLRAKFPPGITQLLALPGVGPKRVQVLYRKLKIASLEDLRRAAREGRIRKLAGFGETSERKILQAAEERMGPRRFPLADAAKSAEPYRAYLEQGGDKVVIAGSYRRKKDTVGDLDFLVVSKAPRKAIERFVAYPRVKEVLAKGTTRAAVALASGIQADLRVVAPQAFGAALHYFTGSKAHNISVRRLGQARGLKINEYGVWRGKRRIAGQTEESVYASVGLPWIAPERREAAVENVESAT
jgi:DNA polymerase (family 10)